VLAAVGYTQLFRGVGGVGSTPVTEASGASDHVRYHNQSFRCVRVVDGDTLDIEIPDRHRETTRIRLWGVDTPEVAKGSRPAMFFGSEAEARTRELVEGRMVRVVLAPDKTRGLYGRLLAYVYLPEGGEMLNELLLSEGLAYADRRFPHVWKNRFVNLESRARRDEVGLWADVKLEQMPDWRQRYERFAAQQSQ
jgi:endonuclease YncB( thermonuclease family)